LTARSSTFLENLRRRYAPKRKPVLKKVEKTEAAPVVKGDEKVDDDTGSVDSMLSDDGHASGADSKPKVDPSVLPKIAQSQAILETLVNEKRELVLQGLFGCLLFGCCCSFCLSFALLVCRLFVLLGCMLFVFLGCYCLFAIGCGERWGGGEEGGGGRVSQFGREELNDLKLRIEASRLNSLE
jgi:hypothetical protein